MEKGWELMEQGLERNKEEVVCVVEREWQEVEKEQIVVHLSSCITHDNFHGPRCPHLDYLKTMIADKAGLDLVEGTHISKLAEGRRAKGIYAS